MRRCGSACWFGFQPACAFLVTVTVSAEVTVLDPQWEGWPAARILARPIPTCMITGGLIEVFFNRGRFEEWDRSSTANEFLSDELPCAPSFRHPCVLPFLLIVLTSFFLLLTSAVGFDVAFAVAPRPCVVGCAVGLSAPWTGGCTPEPRDPATQQLNSRRWTSPPLRVVQHAHAVLCACSRQEEVRSRTMTSIQIGKVDLARPGGKSKGKGRRTDEAVTERKQSTRRTPRVQATLGITVAKHHGIGQFV